MKNCFTMDLVFIREIQINRRILQNIGYTMVK